METSSVDHDAMDQFGEPLPALMGQIALVEDEYIDDVQFDKDMLPTLEDPMHWFMSHSVSGSIMDYVHSTPSADPFEQKEYLMHKDLAAIQEETSDIDEPDNNSDSADKQNIVELGIKEVFQWSTTSTDHDNDFFSSGFYMYADDYTSDAYSSYMYDDHEENFFSDSISDSQDQERLDTITDDAKNWFARFYDSVVTNLPSFHVFDVDNYDEGDDNTTDEDIAYGLNYYYFDDTSLLDDNTYFDQINDHGSDDEAISKYLYYQRLHTHPSESDNYNFDDETEGYYNTDWTEETYYDDNGDDDGSDSSKIIEGSASEGHKYHSLLQTFTENFLVIPTEENFIFNTAHGENRRRSGLTGHPTQYSTVSDYNMNNADTDEWVQGNNNLIRDKSSATSGYANPPLRYSQANSLVFLIIYLSWTCLLAVLALTFFGFMFYLAFKIVSTSLYDTSSRRVGDRFQDNSSTSVTVTTPFNAVEEEGALYTPLMAAH